MARKDRIEHAYPFEVYAPGTLAVGGTKQPKKLDEETYEQQVGELQRRVYGLQIENFQKNRQAIVVFEGWDAAGKGGAIKRLTALMDPRGYKVWPIAAPRDAEPRHHYLWRFWQRLPEKGELAIFDRSWYGRVLVERVEGFASKPEWKRAYDEINAFERMLTDGGVRMLKIFLDIDRKTQLERFERRETDKLRRYKLSEEDWRNRKRWKQYARATQEMFDRTHRPDAPWKVIPGDDKRFARLEVLRAVIALLE